MVDILAIGAHPDDIEISMGGSVCVFKEQGLGVAVCDLTAGEAGTYGTEGGRQAELIRASDILGIDARITLDMPDGNIRNTEENRLKIIEVIRRHTPKIIFSFADERSRHPDHRNTGRMVEECIFLAGLEKIVTEYQPFRPLSLIRFPELIVWRKPDFVIDVSKFWDRKIESIRAHASQVTAEGEDDTNTKTFIRSNRFWELIDARARLFGAMIGAERGEAFYCDRPVKVNDVLSACMGGLERR